MDNYILLYGIIGVGVTIYFDTAIKSNPEGIEPLNTRELIASVLLWPAVVCIWVYAFFFAKDQDQD